MLYFSRSVRRKARRRSGGPMRQTQRTIETTLFFAGLAACAALLAAAALGPAEAQLRRFAVSTAAYLVFCTGGAVLLRRKDPETRFAVLALLLGAAYLFVVTPLAVPDEYHHYRKALTYSNVLLGRGGEAAVPAALLDETGFRVHRCVSSGYRRVLNELFSALPAGGTGSTELASDGYVLFYLPQTLGVTLGRALGVSKPDVFLLGRVGNLLFYAGCLFLSVRRAPRYKTVLGVTALLPMALQQAASLSYDCFTNGAAFLFTAELLYALYGRSPMTKKDRLRLLFTGVLLTPAKAAYVTMLPLVCLVPAERFGGKREKRRAAAELLCLSALALVAVYLPGILSKGPADPRALNWEGGHNYTTAFVLAHPGETLRIFGRSFLDRAPSWAFTAVGGILGGTSRILPFWIPAALLAAAWLAAREPGEGPTAGTRVWFVLAGVGTALLFLITMFFTWTSDDRTIIQGVQGRYFLPVLPLLLIALSLPSRRETARHGLFPPAMAAANALCLWLLLQGTLA